MLKLQRLCLLVSIVVLAGLVLIDGASSQRQAPRSQLQGKSRQPQENTVPDLRGTEQSPLVVKSIPGPTDETKAAEEAKERKEKAELDKRLVDFNADLAFYTKILAAIAFLQFLALLAQAYWLSRTVKVSERAADAAKESADAVVSQLRAYVSVNLDPTRAPVIDAVRGPSVVLVAKNRGQPPAFAASHWVIIGIAPFPNPPALPGPGPGLPFGKTDISPGSEISIVPSPFGPLSAPELASLNAETAMIYVWGEIRYTDAFGKARYTKFNFMYGPQQTITPGSIAYAPEGNEST